MIYNVNKPFEFLKSKKFFKYCVFQLENRNLKALPDLVADLWLLLYLRFVGNVNRSITFKYLCYGCILNPSSFERLLTIDLVYGIRDYFQSVNDFYVKHDSPDLDDFSKLLVDEEIKKEIAELDHKYIDLINSIDIECKVFEYYENNIIDLEFEVNYDSFATTPGNLSLSKVKTKYLLKSYKSLCNKGYFKKQIKQATPLLKNGDVQPGIVVSISPLRIFAYSDDFEGGVMLKYPDEFVKYFNLTINQRVVFVNNYWHKELFSYRYDLLIGENPTQEWRDFIPLLSLLFSDDIDKINTHISKIEESKWDTVNESVKKYVEKFNDYAREGMEYFIEEK
jgi:hypothetical protein